MRILSRETTSGTLSYRRALRSVTCGALLGALLLSACGGGHTGSTASTQTQTSSPAAAPAVAVPGVTIATSTIAIEMPAGVSVGADKLTVVTSAGAGTPNAAGSVSVPIYLNGLQLAIAQSPAGNPMMMGWIDATHTTISASSTAQVLGYFALNGAYLLHTQDAEALIAALPTAEGIAAVEAAVASELAKNIDAFASSDTILSQAVANFATAIFSSVKTASAVANRSHAKAVTITPDVQSGITVVQDPPFAAHLTNSYRRRAMAFVDRVSYSVGGVVTPDPQTVTSFEVAPTIGVNGGVTGTLTDIMAAYWGNQQTAYASVTSPDSGSFATPLVDGSDKTIYQVTVVGAGASAGVTNLTATQSTALTEVALRGFVTDFLVPTFANAILGSGAIDFTKGQGTAQAKFYADLVNSATTDFITFVSSATYDKTKTKIINGQWFDASVDITSTVAGSNTLRSILVRAFEVAAGNAAASGVQTVAASTFFTAFNNILNLAGGGLQVIDSTTYGANLASSDRADQWTLTVTASPVKLNPPQTNIDVGGTVTLTASVLGVEDTSGYSYHWTTTTQVGDLSEVGGASRTHQTDYCSSQNVAVFVYEIGATPYATDTVTVQVYAGPNCDPAKGPLLGSGPATVTFLPSNTLSVTPASTQAKPGDTVALAAALANPVTGPDAIVTYQWSVSGNAGGTLTNPTTGAASTSFESSSATVSYTASANAVSPQQDTVTVTAFLGSKANSSIHSAIAPPATASIQIGETNGCYGLVASITNPGSTYSVTLMDVPAGGGGGGTIQENYAWKGSVAFADPPYTSTGYEYDVTTVYTYQPGSVSNGTNQVATFGSATEDASYVIYGTTETSTDGSGASTVISAVSIPPLPFGKVSQLVPGGAPISLLYAGVATTASGSVPVSYSETWQLLDTPTIHVQAGTFKTCEYQVISSNSPKSIDTKYKLYGYGFEVKETIADTSSGTPVVQDTQEATAVSINGAPYTGP